ncbi:hypothetical protein MTR67_023281 [Solanum verrucosum]|uniref:Uncharacterized protein n=1 Tax=Solanum verrucosum TaxID=315347 RepID=A0AAF0QUX4_SOLVR|nr:hypothetical protein MTR67_023281 [Solanum verrucosum]
MLPDILMISSQVQGLDPLQSMFVQDYMMYSWQAVTSAVGEVSVSWTNPNGGGRGFTPLSKEVFM